MEDFEEKLNSATTVSIHIKKKLPTESPQLGKTGYIVSLKDDVTLGILMTSSTGRACCTSYDRDENDPFNYYLVNSDGQEIITVAGLDYGKNTENIATISTSPLRTKVGTVIYGYPGAEGDSLSKATTYAGRDDSFVIPTSVMVESGDSSAGEITYIFRRDPDNSAYTEILSADGTALTIAEVFVEYKQKSGISHNDPGEERPFSFILNFIEKIPLKHKILVVGVAIALFNQWLRRKQPRKSCFRCTIS